MGLQMARLTAAQLRKITEEREKAEKEEEVARKKIEKKLQIELKKKNERIKLDLNEKINIWKSLYLSALNGNSKSEITNLNESNIFYLKRLGFEIEEVFLRTMKQSEIITRGKLLTDRVAKNDKKISEIEKAIDENNEKIKNLDTELIEEWLYSNQTVAFACDLESWFGGDLNDVFIFSFEHLEELKKTIKEKLETLKNQDTKKSLRILIRAIQKTEKVFPLSIDTKQAEVEIEKLQREIESLEEEIAEIEDNNGLIHPDEIKSIHIVDWSQITNSFVRCNEFEYNVNSLKWFSSTQGQNALKLFDDDVLSINNRGMNKMYLRCIDFDESIYLVNDNGVFNGKFPSSFDFLEAMLLLGFKTSGVEKDMPITQCSVIWK